ncbi:MAG: peptide-methionine (S)-S-oxide reductase MsrA, partial [Spirochaetales bacterium]|nr:peptide-methionine (S)-S-oxide reductase MsrA [Spirochaetales bacterium]
MKTLPTGLLALMFTLVPLLSFVNLYPRGQGEPKDRTVPEGGYQPLAVTDIEGTAVFAGGCFWGMEGLFEGIKGVEEVVSGYSGGTAVTAAYPLVSTGLTGHAEAVLIRFNPNVVSFEFLLEVFLTAAHDPTQLNYQGPDTGTQYRSALFYLNGLQEQTAREYIARLEASEFYEDPIVTQLEPFEAFYPAEDYHQDFMQR